MPEISNIYLMLAIYLVAINLITFITFAVDKRKAIKHKWRVPERVLMLLSLIGGSLCALLAMKVCHHKTKKPLFYIGVPLCLIADIVAVVLILY